MRAMMRSIHGNCAFSSFWYTHWHFLTDRLSTRENIRLNNVETYNESLSIRMVRSFNRCGSINNVFLCNISSLSDWLVLTKFLCSHLLNFCRLIIERIIWWWNGHMNMWSAVQFETSTLTISSLLDFEVSADRSGDVRFWVHFSPDVIWEEDVQAVFYCIRGLSRLISFYSFIYDFLPCNKQHEFYRWLVV